MGRRRWTELIPWGLVCGVPKVLKPWCSSAGVSASCLQGVVSIGIPVGDQPTRGIAPGLPNSPTGPSVACYLQPSGVIWS